MKSNRRIRKGIAAGRFLLLAAHPSCRLISFSGKPVLNFPFQKLPPPASGRLTTALPLLIAVVDALLEQRCPTRGARAVLQLYPENEVQLAMITTSAMRSGFGGGAVVNYPHSSIVDHDNASMNWE
ncbi:hypothetical protein ACLOJK_039870 [Asimina triloba]